MMTEPASSPEASRNSSIQERRAVLLDTARELIESGDENALRLILNSQRAADLADIIPQLKEEERARVFDALAEPLAADVLTDMEIPEMLDIAGQLDDEALTDLVEEMAPDDAADVLGELPDEQSDSVLDLMQEDDARAVRDLLEHDEDTAGGIMTSHLIAVRDSMTVGDAIEHLREWADEDEIVYIYVVDARDHLVGTVPLRRLILSAPDTMIADVTDRDPITVRTDMDQEEIARTFAAYDLLAVPVVDAEGKLVGRVMVDDVVDVIEDEATEDMYVMAATSSEELVERSVFGVVRRRLPWLLICLTGTLLSGSVIHLFKFVLARNGALMIFVPGIMAMGGNTGLQSTTVTVRGLATGQIQAGDVLGTIWRELRIALPMGMILGGLAFVLGQAWTGALIVRACVGIAMLSAVLFSAAMGVLIPISFKAVGVDPAVASGPLITTMNDSISLLIYFNIAALLLHIPL